MLNVVVVLFWGWVVWGGCVKVRGGRWGGGGLGVGYCVGDEGEDEDGGGEVGEWVGVDEVDVGMGVVDWWGGKGCGGEVGVGVGGWVSWREVGLDIIEWVYEIMMLFIIMFKN